MGRSNSDDGAEDETQVLLSNEEMLSRLRGALSANHHIFKETPHATSIPPALEECCLAYAHMKAGDYRSTQVTLVTNQLVVSALFITLVAPFLLNPPTFSVFSDSSPYVSNDHIVRFFFFTMSASVMSFLISVLCATAVLVQMQSAWTDDELPAFMYICRHILRSAWVSQVAAIVLFLISACVMIVATYTSPDRWVAVGIAGILSVIYGLLISKVGLFWSGSYWQRRLASARADPAMQNLIRMERERIAENNMPHAGTPRIVLHGGNN